MKAAREAGATPEELSGALKIAQKVRQVQVEKTEKFSREVGNALAQVTSCG